MGFGSRLVVVSEDPSERLPGRESEEFVKARRKLSTKLTIAVALAIMALTVGGVAVWTRFWGPTAEAADFVQSEIRETAALSSSYWLDNGDYVEVHS